MIESSEYNALVGKLIDKRELANIQTVEYKAVAMKLNIAFKIAKINERFLLEETKNLLNSNLNAAKISDQGEKKQKHWLDDVTIPAIDAKAREFYKNLDLKLKKKFNKHRFIFFVKNFVVPNKKLTTTSRKEKKMRSQFYTGLEDYEASIAARMAIYILKEEIEPLTPEKGFKILRNRIKNIFNVLF